MKTAVLEYHDGRRSIYHMAGTTTVDGVEFSDSRYSWEHPESERSSCDACTKGTIPREIRKGKTT